jgi:hypothetical protein
MKAHIKDWLFLVTAIGFGLYLHSWLYELTKFVFFLVRGPGIAY